MTGNLPGLGALRTFEAAARHLGFTKAASELGVPPAAVTHQMRELEEQLGAKLFWRASRVVRLTPAGEILHTAVAGALEGIGRAVTRLQAVDGRPRLMVTVGPSFAAKWLVPRLHRVLPLFPWGRARHDVLER